MTDNEIIKALECCLGRNGWGDPKCYECPFDGSNPNIGCKKNLLNNALCLINRQIADIDALQSKCDSLRMAGNSFKIHYNTAKAEGIKEFAGMLKIEAFLPIGTWFSERVVTEAQIDNLVKEMTEGSE